LWEPHNFDPGGVTHGSASLNAFHVKVQITR
jgi:hypothetical protein